MRLLRVAWMPCSFDVAVFSNLSRDHLDYHDSAESYGNAKARLFHWPGLKSAVVNVDDDFGRALCANIPRRSPFCVMAVVVLMLAGRNLVLGGRRQRNLANPLG